MPADWLGFLDIGATATARRTFKSALVLPSLGTPVLDTPTSPRLLLRQLRPPQRRSMGITVDEPRPSATALPSVGASSINRTAREHMDDALDVVDDIAGALDDPLLNGLYDAVCGVVSTPLPTESTTTTTALLSRSPSSPTCPPRARRSPTETSTTTTTAGNPQCPGFPSLPLEPRPIFDSFLRDLHDLTAPPPDGS